MAATRNLLSVYDINDNGRNGQAADQLLFDEAAPSLMQTTAPVFTPTSQTADIVQGAPTAATLLQSASISDPDGSGQIVEAVISIANAQSGDALSVIGLSNGTVDGGAVVVSGVGTSTLTFIGAASIDEYDTLLADVTYQDAGSDTTTQGHPTRTVDWTVDDGVLSSAVSTTTVTIDRAPTISAGASTTFDGGQSTAASLDPDLAVSDLDGGNLAGATVTISSGYIPGDTLNFTNQNGVSGVFSNGKLVLTGAASVAAYQTALESITYSFSPSDGDPTGGFSDTSRTISWTVNDGVTHSATAVSALTAVHEPPVLTAGGTAYYSQNDLPAPLDPNVAVADPDSDGQLQSVVVQISSGFESGDMLTYSLAQTNGITPSYNFFTHSYVFSGQDTVADYQALLSSLTFSTTAGDTSPTSRTITWLTYDGVAFNSTVETSTVEVTPPCFVRGARILTLHGEIEVQRLAVGDLVVTASGRARPIVWIGHRSIDLDRHHDPAAVRPVRVRADAFDEGLPRRDLWLSPGHNLACEGALIAADLLLNGVSVAQPERRHVEYWHVELDAHDVLFAEGLAVESYLDTGNRTAFENGGAFIEARPDFQPKHWAQTCLPLAFDGPAVAATKKRLLARLSEFGQVVEPDAEARIWVDGLSVDPMRLSATRIAFLLPKGGVQISLRSRTFVPAHMVPESCDPRTLGLCVAALQIDGSPMALADIPICAPGWNEAEHQGETFTHRWTSGETPLPGSARLVIIDLAGVGCYLSGAPADMIAYSAPIQSYKTLARP